MFEHYTPDAWMTLAKARHQAALEAAAAHRLLPQPPAHAAARRLRDRLGDWLIDAGQRIKTGTVTPEARPSSANPSARIRKPNHETITHAQPL